MLAVPGNNNKWQIVHIEMDIEWDDLQLIKSKLIICSAFDLV